MRARVFFRMWLPVAVLFSAGAVTAQEPARDCSVCPRMITVPAGVFEMGSRHGEGNPNEWPLHRVDVSRFEIGVSEVTAVEFEAFRKATGQKPHICPRQSERLLVAGCISWFDAVEYTDWLSRVTGRRYRLPSESEWEYVARGHAGSTGAVNMMGNVREWVSDCWHPDYNGAPRDGRKWEAGGDCDLRVMRGRTARPWPTSRIGITTENVRVDNGFRVARTIE